MTGKSPSTSNDLLIINHSHRHSGVKFENGESEQDTRNKDQRMNTIIYVHVFSVQSPESKITDLIYFALNSLKTTDWKEKCNVAKLDKVQHSSDRRPCAEKTHCSSRENGKFSLA